MQLQQSWPGVLPVAQQVRRKNTGSQLVEITKPHCDSPLRWGRALNDAQ